MGAALAIAAAAPRSVVREGASIGGTRKPASGPKTPPANRNRSTAGISGRSLLTADDLRAAIAWRIDGIPAIEIEAIATALRPLAADFRETRPEVAAVLADLRRPGDRRGAWSLACAVLARDAEMRCDLYQFAAAVAVLASSLDQRDRSIGDRSPLTPLMRDLKKSRPGLKSDQAFAYFAGLCSGSHEVIAGFSDDALVLHDGRRLSRDSFCRQYRRL
jgi:hypothetical protein